jgi:hypothetical protein
VKNILSVLFLLFASLFLVTSASASGFYIESIGQLQVGGTAYDHYWYTGANPVITGIAPASASVSVTVDGTASSVTADASGNWSYQSTIAEGDHTISLSTASISTPYSFTLTIGATPDGVSGIDTATTPVAGVATPTLMLLVFGIGLLITPILLRKAIAHS